MKLATALGACFSKNWQVMRPMEVSKTTVGPVGTTGRRDEELLVVLGASGRSTGGFAGGHLCECRCGEGEEECDGTDDHSVKSSIDEAIVLGGGTQSGTPVTGGAVSASHSLEEIRLWQSLLCMCR